MLMLQCVAMHRHYSMPYHQNGHNEKVRSKEGTEDMLQTPASMVMVEKGRPIPSVYVAYCCSCRERNWNCSEKLSA
jgi:hypothetical protein